MMRKALAVVAVAISLAVLPACQRKTTPPLNDVKLANKVSRRNVSLYFESEDLLLVPETRSVELPENDAAAISAVVSELLKGSANSSVPRLLPADTTLRAAYLLPEGNAIIDLAGPTLVNGWNTGSHTELMAVYSLVQTVTTDFSSVKRVRLLVNGQPASTLAGHIDLGRALAPNLSLVAKR